MAEDLGYGDRLSGAEYDRRIVELHRNAPPMPSKEEGRQIRRRELDLAIDYRLGTKFPQNRREQLWVIMERVEQKRLRLALKYIFKRLLMRNKISKGIHHEAENVAGFMVDEFSSVLNERELRSFFELEPGEKPSLPGE